MQPFGVGAEIGHQPRVRQIRRGEPIQHNEEKIKWVTGKWPEWMEACSG